jgi:hypothetical protein
VKPHLPFSNLFPKNECFNGMYQYIHVHARLFFDKEGGSRFEVKPMENDRTMRHDLCMDRGMRTATKQSWDEDGAIAEGSACRGKKSE